MDIVRKQVSNAPHCSQRPVELLNLLAWAVLHTCCMHVAQTKCKGKARCGESSWQYLFTQVCERRVWLVHNVESVNDWITNIKLTFAFWRQWCESYIVNQVPDVLQNIAHTCSHKQSFSDYTHIGNHFPTVRRSCKLLYGTCIKETVVRKLRIHLYHLWDEPTTASEQTWRPEDTSQR